MLSLMAKKRTRKTDSGKGVDRHTTPRLVFHLPPEMLSAFRAHLDGLEPRPHESEVLRVALKRYLESVGFWPPPLDDK